MWWQEGIPGMSHHLLLRSFFPFFFFKVLWNRVLLCSSGGTPECQDCRHAPSHLARSLSQHHLRVDVYPRRQNASQYELPRSLWAADLSIHLRAYKMSGQKDVLGKKELPPPGAQQACMSSSSTASVENAESWQLSCNSSGPKTTVHGVEAHRKWNRLPDDRAVFNMEQLKATPEKGSWWGGSLSGQGLATQV